ncbi:hypothetical protein M3Y99_01495100 [Aphelenchoides fujianensis]|nr:hypothetical protein M3Y99_01495100 [Aphelenchoides fujianensis]
MPSPSARSDQSIQRAAAQMSVCIDDFERQAALRIDGSRKSLPELIVELRTMLESRLYVGEEVRFESLLNRHVGRVIDCIELQTAQGIERKYTVLCDRDLHKNIDSAHLERTREVSDEALTRFIKQTAIESYITKTWSVDNWGSFSLAFSSKDYRLWKDITDALKPEPPSREAK